MKTDIVFENLKVGDKLHSLMFGEVTVCKLIQDKTESYPIICSGVDSDGEESEYSYTIDGKYITTHNESTLFLTNPFEKLNQERVIEVESINGIWIKRVCIKVVDGKAICWGDSKTIEESKITTYTTTWSTWRELQPEQPETKQPKEITLDGVEYVLTPKTK